MFATKNTQHHSKGQSLVETALFLPILIILLGGLVEVSNLLVTQNRVSTAARAATGFGAANYRGDDWNDSDAWSTAMANVAMNNVTDTLDLDPDLWDIYVVKATLNPDGTSFEEWNGVHAHGNGNVINEDQWNARQSQMQADVLDALSDSDLGLEIVATLAFHDRQSLLGLNAFNFGALTQVRGLSVMRVDPKAAFVGCPIVPISLRLNQFSAYPSNWPEGESYNAADPGDPATQLFPDGSGPNNGFEYPTGSDIPVYLNNPSAAPGQLDTDTFERNVPGKELLNAQPGYIYWAREEGPSGSFGWLSWDGSTSANDLRDSLIPPGNFRDKYPGSPADMGTTGDPPYEDTGDGDGVLQLGEWVENSTGNISSAEWIIQDYVDNEEPVTLIVYDATNGKTGSNANYRVARFVKVRILGYSFQGSNENKWILFEFVDWAGECTKIE
ncbi:MAG TPA: TadE/TadG family type IV pilus assembly protein [Candidatus Sulfomarinibacteraceae bacterium]|nr:TadE/TadG family type IV pilus assembly protein [Candidatus Sulfomarinibacteraceae bacterium]